MSQTPPRTLDAVIDRQRVVVCVGSGGVGKTTVAASFALEAARRGRRVVVVTIDPAQRLADALGTSTLGNEPKSLPRAALAAQGVPEAGNLSALMLDMKRTFDDLVKRFSAEPGLTERLLENRIYQHVSDALAGSAEYAAMEKVFELSQDPQFDLIVLDTPPSQHALDFLESPERLLEFLDSRLVQLLVHPAFSAGRFGFRLFQRSAAQALALLERATGVGFLEDISEFLMAFEEMSQGFRKRARGVRQFLLGPESSFLLISGPSPESVHHTLEFLARLDDADVPLAGVVLNRMQLWPDGGPPPAAIPAQGHEDDALAALAGALQPLLPVGLPAEAVARAALSAVSGYASGVRAEELSTERVRESATSRGCFSCSLPELDGDVHSLTGLTRLAEHWFGKESGSSHGD